MKPNLFSLIILAVLLTTSHIQAEPLSQEVQLGGHSATLRLNEKPTTRQATFTLPKPPEGKSWYLTMHTKSASGSIATAVKGKTTDGKEISLKTALGDNELKAETGMLLEYRPKNPITCIVTFEVSVPPTARGRGPWDGSISLRANQR